MYIEQIFPEVVGGKSAVLDLLEVEAREQNIPDVGAFIASVPKPLRDAPAFLDKMTNLWRYEFGIPYELGEELVWGTHMWGPVHCLFTALLCVHLRLPEGIRGAYLKRLANPKKHQATLVEMIPCSRVSGEIGLFYVSCG